VRINEIINAVKSDVDLGSWKPGPVAASAFRLSKSGRRSYQLGASYAWRVVRFEALAERFRILVAFHEAKESYRAWLAQEVGNDLRVLARYEYHGYEPGWHCHAHCGDVRGLGAGIVKNLGEKRFPRVDRSRRVDFEITEDNALTVAAKFYGLNKTDVPKLL